MNREQVLEGALQELLEQVQSLEDCTLSRDVARHEAEAIWDAAIRRAEDALKRGR